MYIVVSLVINYLVYSEEVFDGKHMPSFTFFFHHTKVRDFKFV